MLLSSVNSRQVVLDALSRLLDVTYSARDCHMERFLQELQDKIACMTISLESLAILSMTNATISANTMEFADQLITGAGPIPLGSCKAWLNMQSECNNCCKFADCRTIGQVRHRKDKDRALILKLNKTCRVKNGLIVTNEFNAITMRESTKVTLSLGKQHYKRISSETQTHNRWSHKIKIMSWIIIMYLGSGINISLTTTDPCLPSPAGH